VPASDIALKSEAAFPFRIFFAAAAGALVAALTLVVPYIQHWGGEPFSRPDADIAFAFQALLMGDGGPQRDIAHHGYTYFLLLSWWYHVAYWFGAVPVDRLSQLAGLADPLSAYAKLIDSGRQFSLLMGMTFSVLFLATVWRATGDAVAAIIATAVVALGTGNGFQTIVLRTELPAVLFLWLAFFALIEASRAAAWRVSFWLALAGLFACLAYNVKVHVLFSLLALPVLAVAFGRRREAVPAASPDRSTLKSAVVFAVLLIAVTPAWVALISNIGNLGPLSRVYIPLIVALCALCMVVYARLYDIKVRQSVISGAAIVAGFGAGLALVFLHYHPQVIEIDANPLEHMTTYLLEPGVQSPEPGQLGKAGFAILGHVFGHIKREWLGPDPLAIFRFEFWVAAAGLVTLLLLRKFSAAVQVGLLIGLTSLLHGIDNIRYGATAVVYCIFIEPWILLAFGVTIATLRSATSMRFVRLAVTLGACALAALMIKKNIAVASQNWTQSKADICAVADEHVTPNLAMAFRPLCQ